MNSLSENETYPDFNYPAAELVKFNKALNVFSILLKDRSIVHFEPNDGDSFYNWLMQHNVEDLRKESGNEL
jgi:hypothetical protein